MRGATVNRALRLLLMGAAQSGAAAGITYTLRGLFGTPAAAPLGSPLSLDVGSVTLVDTGNKASITSDGLVYNGAESAGTDPQITGAAFVNYPGVVLTAKVTGASPDFGFVATANSTLRTGVNFYAGKFYQYMNGVQVGGVLAINTATQYTFAVIRRYEGSFVFMDGALMGVDLIDATASPIPLWGQFIPSTNTTKYREIALYNAGGVYANRSAFASVYTRNVTANTPAAHPADGLIACTITLVEDDIKNLYFRYTDADNCWILRMTQTTGIELIKKEGGTESVVASKAGALSTHTNIQAWAYCNGTQIVVACSSRTCGTTSSFGQSSTTAFVDTTANVFATYALTGHTLPTISDTPPIIFATFGDSKTANDGTAWRWQSRLEYLIEQQGGRGCVCSYNGATSGDKVADLNTRMAGYLAAAPLTCDYALVNIGVNDALAALGDEATFKTNYLAVLDAIHNQWANCKVYCARVWSRGDPTECATANGWIDYCIGQRAFAYAGPNEPVWLEGGDDGATNTDDGTHYSDAGKTACAAAWKSAMGL